MGWQTQHEIETETETGNLTLFFRDSCTFFILFSFMIPMSLYVCLEISKFIQALFMEYDIHMSATVDVHEHLEHQPKKKKVYASVNTSNLNEELGQVFQKNEFALLIIDFSHLPPFF